MLGSSSCPAPTVRPFWEGADLFLDAVKDFLAGIEAPEGTAPRYDRAMATLLFTDIVGSTERASELGDRGWRDVLDLHNEWSRRRVRENEGRLINTRSPSTSECSGS